MNESEDLISRIIDTEGTVVALRLNFRSPAFGARNREIFLTTPILLTTTRGRKRTIEIAKENSEKHGVSLASIGPQ